MIPPAFTWSHNDNGIRPSAGRIGYGTSRSIAWNLKQSAMKTQERTRGTVRETGSLLFSMLFLTAEEAEGRVRKIKNRARSRIRPYQKSISALVWSTWILPILYILVAAFGDPSLKPAVGAVVTTITFLLFFFTSPVRILSEGLVTSLKDSFIISATYFKNILAIELCVILSVWIIPIENNLSLLFPAVPAAFFLGLLGAAVFKRKAGAVLFTLVMMIPVWFIITQGSLLTALSWLNRDMLLGYFPFVAVAVLLIGLLFALVSRPGTFGVTGVIVVVLFGGLYFLSENVPFIGNKLQSLNLPQVFETKMPADQALIVTSSPPGADVYVNGQYKGRTPLVRVRGEDLDKHVIVSAPGYAPRILEKSDIRNNTFYVSLQPERMGSK